MSKEMILVLDFGGQYNQLIARRVREQNVYSEVRPYTTSIEEIKALNPKGIILTGGPSTVYEDDAPKCSPELFKLGIPVLGICYVAVKLSPHPSENTATPTLISIRKQSSSKAFCPRLSAG